jgi:hypothetical protein
MGPVNRFAKILQAFTSDSTDPNNPKIRIARYDENGKLISEGVVDPAAIGVKLGAGFGAFVNNIFLNMDKVEENMVSRGTIKKINNLMSPVTSFVDIVSLFEGAKDNKLIKVTTDENGKIKETKEIDIIAISSAIASTFDTFVSTISTSLTSVEGISEDGAAKKIKALNTLTSGIKGFAEELEKAFVSDEELSKFRKNVDEINSSLRNIGDLYKSSLDEKMTENLPKLKKNHHDFLNALEKDTKSIRKPLQEYIKLLKEVNEQYSTLVPHVESLNKNAVTFVLDQGTKYETKMDDDAARKFAEAYSESVAPSVQKAISDVIDSITATFTYTDTAKKNASIEFLQK